MTEADKLIFFDLPTVDPANPSWSPNTWKTRYSLNYKRIPYRTEWVEFPDIADVCKKYGAPPTSTKPDGAPHYTVPMLYDPATRTAVVDSDVIARYLDATYPATPPLFPPGSAALQTAVIDWLFPGVDDPLSMVMLGEIAPLLPARSREYFLRTREAAFGGPMDKVCVDAARDEKWAALEEGLGKIVRWLAANGPGKDQLFMGDKVSYVDIQLASILTYGRVVMGTDSADWKRVASMHGGRWARFLDYFDQWATIA